MKKEIEIVENDNGDFRIRKVVLKKDGRISRKYSLNKDGKWVRYGENEVPPEECIFENDTEKK